MKKLRRTFEMNREEETCYGCENISREVSDVFQKCFMWDQTMVNKDTIRCQYYRKATR